MQLKYEIKKDKRNEVYLAIQPERIARYYAASEDASVSKLDMYTWNCNLAESFYPSLHYSEIVCRNAIHSALQHRKSDEWINDPTFRGLLSSRFLGQLDSAIAEETSQHGSNMTPHHIVSSLTFGFWEHLTIKRFERYLFPRGFQRAFPNAHYSLKLQDLHDTIEKVRRWRNRVAHHRALFDKGPTSMHHDAIKLIRWRCETTADFVQSISRVPQVINSRPNNNDL